MYQVDHCCVWYITVCYSSMCYSGRRSVCLRTVLVSLTAVSPSLGQVGYRLPVCKVHMAAVRHMFEHCTVWQMDNVYHSIEPLPCRISFFSTCLTRGQPLTRVTLADSHVMTQNSCSKNITPCTLLLVFLTLACDLAAAAAVLYCSVAVLNRSHIS